MPKFRAVLFDRDGTLLDSFEKYYHAINAALADCGFEKWSREKFMQRLWGRKLRPNLDSVLSDVPAERRQDVLEAYRKALPKFESLTKLFPSTVPTLDMLKRSGLKLGVVTTTDRAIVMKILERYGLLSFMDTVVGGDEAASKPSPEPILLACKRLNVEPSEALYVGDTPVDAEAGKAAGCTTAIVTTSYNAVDLQEIGGILIIDDLNELLGILEK